MLVNLFTIIAQIVSSILLAAIAITVILGIKNNSAKYVEGVLIIICSIIAAITSWGIILLSKEIRIMRRDNKNYARINGKYELLNEELTLEVASLGN